MPRFSRLQSSRLLNAEVLADSPNSVSLEFVVSWQRSRCAVGWIDPDSVLRTFAFKPATERTKVALEFAPFHATSYVRIRYEKVNMLRISLDCRLKVNVLVQIAAREGDASWFALSQKIRDVETGRVDFP